jgi:hypothetical protein
VMLLLLIGIEECRHDDKSMGSSSRSKQERMEEGGLVQLAVTIGAKQRRNATSAVPVWCQLSKRDKTKSRSRMKRIVMCEVSDVCIVKR